MLISVALSTLALATANADSILYLGSTEMLTYDAAQLRCESFGGHLATFGSTEEFEALLTVRNSLGASIWIGLDDRDTEGHWNFIDGDTSFCAPYTSFCQGTGTGNDCSDIPQWAPGEPNNWGGNEDCGELYSDAINDQDCAEERPYACEINGNRYAATEEGGAIYVARGDDYVDYATAKERCASFGGQLATFSSEAQFAAMLSVRNAIGVDTWIGFDDLNTEHHWQFVDGDLSFCQPQGTGTDCDDIPQWNPGQPNNSGGNEDCGDLWSGAINDDACAKKQPYVCEFDTNSFAFTMESSSSANSAAAVMPIGEDGTPKMFGPQSTSLIGQFKDELVGALVASNILVMVGFTCFVMAGRCNRRKYVVLSQKALDENENMSF